MSTIDIRRGDIFYIYKTGCRATGSEMLSGRPGIVVSNDQNNKNSPTVEIVYCTTQDKTELPTHVEVLSTPQKSTVLCEQVTTVSVERIGDFIGACNEEEMMQIDKAIKISLGLDVSMQEEKENRSLGHDSTDSVAFSDKEVMAIKIKLETYKEMYEQLLKQLVQNQK